jgi:hypothetical protein
MVVSGFRKDGKYNGKYNGKYVMVNSFPLKSTGIFPVVSTWHVPGLPPGQGRKARRCRRAAVEDGRPSGKPLRLLGKSGKSLTLN